MYACRAQFHPFVGERHHEVIDPLVLQQVGDFHGTAAVGEGFHHDGNPCPWGEERAEMVQVVHHGIHVHLQYRHVRLFLQESGDVFQPEFACSLDKNDLVVETVAVLLAQEAVGVLVKAAPRQPEVRLVAAQFFPDTDEKLHAGFLQLVGDLPVECLLLVPDVHEIRQDDHLLPSRVLHGERVKRQPERGGVRIVVVIDEHAAVDAFLDFHTHGDGLQALRPGSNPCQRFPLPEEEAHRIHPVLIGRFVGKRQAQRMPFPLPLEFQRPPRAVGAVGKDAHLRPFLLSPRHPPCRRRRHGHDALQRLPGAPDDHLARPEQHCLFPQFLLAGGEILPVGVAQVGKDADARADDAFQPLHLAGLGDACLDDRQPCLRLDAQHGERHAHL